MAAAEGLLRCVFEGCLAASDMGKERRPYHRNCGCALHNKKRCTKVSSCSSRVSYAVRRSWIEGCLVLAASLSSSSSASPSSPSICPSLKRERCHVVLCGKEECDLMET